MLWAKEDYTIDTSIEMLDIDTIHHYLSKEAYWCLGIPRETIETAINNSICFGVYFNNEQVGFARMISDKATFAYLADVFILSEHQGKGLSKWMMECIQDHPELQGLRRVMLATSDAHGLYKQYGFSELEKPALFLEINNKDIYRNNNQSNI